MQTAQHLQANAATRRLRVDLEALQKRKEAVGVARKKQPKTAKGEIAQIRLAINAAFFDLNNT